jgi:hypothetical protein
LLEKYDLTKKIIAYVKDHGYNLGTMAIALKFFINYDRLDWRKILKFLVWAYHVEGMNLT